MFFLYPFTSIFFANKSKLLLTKLQSLIITMTTVATAAVSLPVARNAPFIGCPWNLKAEVAVQSLSSRPETEALYLYFLQICVFI